MRTMPVSLFAAAILPIILFCQSSYPPELTSEHFSQWFVDVSQKVEDTIATLKIPMGVWDSLSAASKQSAGLPPGASTAVLRDSSGLTYTLGWKTPANIRRDTTYPLIIYLHGGIGTQLTTKGEKAYEMLSPLGDSLSLFLASPSANRYAPWWSATGLYRITQTLRFMSLHYPINPDKVFLAGVSDGATACYAVANTMCGPFAGFIAVSGFGGMLSNFAFQLYPTNIMQRPIYSVNAGKDRLYPLEEVDKFLDWLANNGVSVERKHYPDEQHGFDYRDKEFGKLASCIRAWSKPAENRGISWTFSPGLPNCPDNIVSWRLQTGSSSPQVNAYWRGDTLQLDSRGVTELVVSFPGITAEDIIVCKNRIKTERIAKLPASSLRSYENMVRGGFPYDAKAADYRIKLP
jgi:pimeloyl-ACP methyl ester carboxylesterase